MRAEVRVLLCAVVSAALIPGLSGQERVSKPGVYRGYATERYSAWTRGSQYITTRDGTRLAVDVYRPSVNGVPVDAKYPVVWEHVLAHGRTRPDGSAAPIYGPGSIAELTKYGYVVAAVDRRGKGASFGAMRGYHDRTEAGDAYDVTEWLAAQPWSDGKIGMFGCSNTGEAVMHGPTNVPPHLKAIFPGNYSFNKYDGFLRGGILANWGSGPDQPYTNDLTTLPVDGDRDGALLKAAVEEHKNNTSLLGMWRELPFRDSWSTLVGSRYWQEGSASTYLTQIERSQVAIYSFDGWYDDFRRETFVATANLRNPSKVLMGPWEHCRSEGFDLVTERRRFFDYWLKGIDNGIATEPPIHYYTVGAAPGSEWRSAASWPLPTEAPTNYYLGAGQSLGLAKPTSAAAGDAYTVNYGVTCPEGRGLFTQICSLAQYGATYTTPPLVAPLEVTGHPIVHLWMTSPVDEGNLFAYLEDVSPDGAAAVATDGRLRASLRAVHTPPYRFLGLPYHRSFKEDAAPLPRNEPVELVFDMLPTSRVFATGHRVRVTITAADPREKDRVEVSPPPQLRFLREQAHASFIILPVIPAK